MFWLVVEASLENVFVLRNVCRFQNTAKMLDFQIIFSKKKISMLATSSLPPQFLFGTSFSLLPYGHPADSGEYIRTPLA